ncbi:MAG: 5'-methylthioadenosine/S-adenosylhomocysteine nucleosidase [Pseudomonadota bacterium]
MDDPRRHVRAIGGINVLFLMATPQEYGPHLRSRIDPLIIGVGPVEAAAATGAALAMLRQSGLLPQILVSLGSAGSRTLDHAGVYQVESVSYRDMDASPLGFERGCTPFADHPAVIALPHRIAGVPGASLSTGGAIISGAAYDAIPADMVDMETFAVLRAAHRFGVDLVGLRGITDGRTTLERYEDWADYLHLIDEKLALALDAFAAQAQAGHLLSAKSRP